MTVTRLLYLNTHRLAAYAWRRGALAPEGVFEASPEGHQRFADYLQANADSPFLLLCNVAEEGHQVEIIPFLRGQDRQTLIERKSSQLFFGTSLATAISLGYEKSRRKNERLLLSALTNPGHLQPWLTAIAAAEAPLAGVYTVSQLGGQLLGPLIKPLPERCLLLTQQDHSIRASFIVGGVPVFSRMSALHDSSIAGIAAAFAADAGKLHQYLAGQRQIARNDTLPVYVLSHPQAMATVNAACAGATGLAFEIIDSQAASRHLGLAGTPADSRCDTLFLHLLATATPRQQYLADDFRHDYHLHWLKRGLLGAGAATLLAALLFAGKQLVETRLNQAESAGLAADEQQLGQRYQQIATTFPQLGIDNDTLRRVAGRYQDLRRVQREPGPAYRLLSQALDQSPAIALDAIEWRLGAATTGQSGTGAPLARGNLLIADEETALVRGSVHIEQDAQPRQVLAAFERFINLLHTDPNLRITILQRPFDIESGRTLKGGSRDDDNPQPRAFAFQFTRKLPPS